MTLDDLRGHTSFNRNVRLHIVNILEKFLKHMALNKKNIAEKDDLEILR